MNVLTAGSLSAGGFTILGLSGFAASSLSVGGFTILGLAGASASFLSAGGFTIRGLGLSSGFLSLMRLQSNRGSCSLDISVDKYRRFSPGRGFVPFPDPEREMRYTAGTGMKPLYIA